MSTSHEQILSIILGNTPGLLGLQNKKLAYEVVNPFFAQFIGKSPAEILGKQDAELFGAEEAALSAREAETVLNLGLPRTVRQSLTGRKGMRWFEITRAPIFGESGDPEGLYLLGLDITELRGKAVAGDESVARLQEAEQRAAQAEVERGQAAEEVTTLSARTAELEQQLGAAQSLQQQLDMLKDEHQAQLQEAQQRLEALEAEKVRVLQTKDRIERELVALQTQQEQLRELARQVSAILET